jgi:hypothetical protein
LEKSPEKSKKKIFAPFPLEIYLQKYKKLANPGLVLVSSLGKLTKF